MLRLISTFQDRRMATIFAGIGNEFFVYIKRNEIYTDCGSKSIYTGPRKWGFVKFHKSFNTIFISIIFLYTQENCNSYPVHVHRGHLCLCQYFQNVVYANNSVEVGAPSSLVFEHLISPLYQSTGSADTQALDRNCELFECF